MNRILVIDDEPQMRQGLRTLLRCEGYTVTEAADGVAGIAAARSAPPDLVLCDIRLPGLDGYGVLAALRADAQLSGTPLVFLTALGAHTQIREGMGLGADDYLVKPVSRHDLLQAVTARLRRQHQHALAARRSATRPDFSSAVPLQSLGLTPREADIVLWLTQGKTNPEIALIVGAAEGTVRKHLQHIFAKLGVETRTAAAGIALKILLLG